METKKLIVFIDSGDTIIDESTEIRDQNDVVLHAKVIPGADLLVKTLAERGHTIALVADGLSQSFKNIFTQNGLYNYFSALIYSENVGSCKPSSKMFQTAVDTLGLSKEDYNRIIMVGNNLSRDIKGANNFGITSVFLSWTPRYPKTPSDESEVPDYTISTPMELIDLINSGIFVK